MNSIHENGKNSILTKAVLSSPDLSEPLVSNVRAGDTTNHTCGQVSPALAGRTPDYILRDILTPDEPRSTRDWAIKLYGMGLNVMPLPHGQKTPVKRFAWRQLIRRRFAETDIPVLWPQSADMNIAVICGYAGLFVLDYDDVALFDASLLNCRLKNIEPFAVKTGRGGHLYFSADGPLPKTMPGSGVEVKAAGSYVVGPGSLHPSGSRYTHICGESIPTVRIEDLHWHALEPVSVRKRRSRPTVGNRNNSLFADAISARNNGFTLHKALDTLEPRYSELGLSVSEIRATVKSAYSRDSGTGQKLQALRQFALSHPWPGRTRTTDMNTWLALVERWRVDGHGTGIFRASRRELQELAGISDHTTLRKSLQRMQDAGLLVHVPCKHKRRCNCPSEWRLNVNSACGNNPPTIGSVCNVVTTGVNIATTLPASQQLVYQALCGGERSDVHHAQRSAETCDAIASESGLPRRTVSWALSRLQERGMVASDGARPATWRVVETPDALGQLAREYDARRDTLRERHEAERQDWLFRQFTRALDNAENSPTAPKTGNSGDTAS